MKLYISGKEGLMGCVDSLFMGEVEILMLK